MGKVTNKLDQNEHHVPHKATTDIFSETNNDFYKFIFNSLEDYAIVTTDIDGLINDCNSGMEHVFGYTKHELIGQNTHLIFTNQDKRLQKPTEELQLAAKTGKTKADRWHVRKDGTVIWTSNLVFPIKNNVGDLIGFTKIMRDLTEQVTARKQFESEIQKAKMAVENEKQRLSTLFMEAPAMIAIMRGPNHTYEFANPVYLKVVGKTLQIIGKTVVEVFPELKKQPIVKMLDTVYKTGIPFTGNEVLVQIDSDNTGVVNDLYFNFVYQPSINSKGKVDGIIVHAVEVTTQVEARKQVEQSEERFRILTEHSADAIALTDSKGIITYVSSSVKSFLGYKVSDMVGKPGSLFVHPDDLHGIEKQLIGVMDYSGKAMTVQHRAIHKNGSVRWLETTATNLYDNPSINTLVTNFRDITDSKKAEEILIDTQNRLENALAAGTIATWAWDIPNNRVVGDKNMAKFFGVTTAQAYAGLPSNAFIKAVHPEDQPVVEKQVGKVVKNGGNFETEYRLINKAGVVRWVLARGKVKHNDSAQPIRFDGVLMDITERKKAEKALIDSEERFHQLADAMPQMVWTARPDGYLDYFNKQWYEYTGFKETYGDQSWEPILHPDDLLYCNESWYKAVRTGEPYTIEYRFKDRTKPGQYRWFLGRALPVKNSKGEIIKWFGTCTDIDAVKRTSIRKDELEQITENLTLQREQLVELNDAKDEFISVASHQLRTPATGVKQYIGMLLEGYVGALTVEQESFLRNAYSSNERQLNIVNDLLRVARIDAGKEELHIEKTDLVLLIKDVIKEQASKFAERSQNITFTPSRKKILVAADTSRIRMVLENIIDNASKYTFKYKSIDIAVTQTTKFINIAIKDEGVGISKANQEKIFRKFSVIENPLTAAAGGTGLGLYWAKKIMELHGGNIKVSSNGKKGSVFTIEVPIVSQQAED